MKRMRKMKEIVARYWPTPPKEEVEAASAQVWNRLEAELKEHDTSLWSLSGDGWNAAALNQREFQVLTAIAMLRPEGNLRSITRIVERWADGFRIDHCVVAVSRVQERGLARSRELPRVEGDRYPRFVWELTEDGERALARARAEGRDVADVREFAKAGCVQRPT